MKVSSSCPAPADWRSPTRRPTPALWRQRFRIGGLAHSNGLQFIDLISVTSAGVITSSYVSANTSNTSRTLFVSSGGHLVATIALALMCSNCALRSGCFEPSSALRFDCRL